MVQKTPLHDKHLESGAKMVEFAQFLLPIHYGSQINEHQAVRQDCGMFDVSHMNVVDIVGIEAKAYMRYLIANDVAKLTTPYQAMYSCMLNKNSGVVDDLIVYFIDEEHYRLVLNAATRQKDMNHISEVAKGFNVKLVQKTDLAMIAVQGPNAIAKFNEAMPGTTDMVAALVPFSASEVGSLFIARTGYTGEDGLELILPAKSAPFTWQMLLDVGVLPCGLGARDTLRLEAGMSLYGNEMDDDTSPLDAGLSWTVDRSDAHRDFIGKDKLRPKKFDLIGLVLKDKAMMRHGQIVKGDMGEGVVTSGGFSPSIKRSIALARLPTKQNTIEVQDNTVAVAVHHQWLSAQVVKPVFVRKGVVLVK